VVLGNKSVLDGLDLKIPAKSMVAFVGPSGSGKTTLIQTILGLVRPSSGEVFYDQKSISGIDMRSIRRHIAYVPQESVVLEGSLRDNIALGLAADDEMIRQALKLSNLSELIALYRKPTVLVLDEATSSLDLESERFIQETLESLSGQITLIVVAHRLSTVRAADKIYFLDSGVVSESGTHEELMKRKGAYSKMVAGKEML
jgi:ATP-binding cassette subfamily B protein